MKEHSAEGSAERLALPRVAPASALSCQAVVKKFAGLVVPDHDHFLRQRTDSNIAVETWLISDHKFNKRDTGPAVRQGRIRSCIPLSDHIREKAGKSCLMC